MKLSDIQNTNLPRIAVLFGGNSSEYQVSLSSGSAVLRAIDTGKYMPIPVGISKEGRWFLYAGDYDAITADRWQESGKCFPIYFSGDQSAQGFLISIPSSEFSSNELSSDETASPRLVPLSVQAVIPVLHGKNGEDGTVQGLFALLGIPVIGCGILSSSLCMDKERAHQIASTLGISVPASFCAYEGISEDELYRAADSLGYPLFVKPVRAGSSFGITCIQDKSQLLAAVKEAFLYDTRIIIEEKIEGFEVGCAVMGRNFNPAGELTIGEVDEIELTDGFFDYTEKYTLKTSKIHVPARISPEKTKEIKDTAARLYLGLDCDYFARVDLFLTPEGKIYFNEVNTIPGFTSHSRFPGMMKSRGIEFPDLVNRLIEMEV